VQGIAHLKRAGSAARAVLVSCKMLLADTISANTLMARLQKYSDGTGVAPSVRFHNPLELPVNGKVSGFEQVLPEAQMVATQSR